MTTVRPRPLADILASRTRNCVDLASVAAAVCEAYRVRIPYRFGCLATTDPSTGLISWAWKTHPLNIGDEEFAAAEYGGWDINLFAEIGTRPEPVGVCCPATPTATRVRADAFATFLSHASVSPTSCGSCSDPGD